MKRRYRVALRPQARRERQARAAAAAAIFLSAAAVVYVARRVPKDALSPAGLARRIPSPEFLRVEHVGVSGVSAALQAQLAIPLASLTGKPWGLWAAGEAERELLRRFPFLEAASARRDWRGRGVTFAVIPRTPVARASRRGRPAGWLSDTGIVFEAPEGAYPVLDLPAVELGDSGASLPALAEFVRAAGAELPSKLVRVALRSPEEGWEVTVADQTTLLWGQLDWTREKIARLKEVLGDAGKRFGAGLTADLRYFEDGKILVRPRLGAGPSKEAGPGARTR